MSINLLPTEEKVKSGKIKYTPTPIIEMTGPVKLEKSTSKAKRGGVLSFFKQAFDRPKPIVPDADKQLPQRKILLEEKVVFEKPKPQASPRPIIKMVAPKPESMQVRDAVPIGERMGNFFRSIFGARVKTPVVPAAEPQHTPAHAFPKYQPIRAEKMKVQEQALKPKPVEVITVTTNGKQPEPQHAQSAAPLAARRIDIPYEGFPKVEPAFKVIKQTSVPLPRLTLAHDSVWKKISRWLKKLFSRTPKQQITKTTEAEVAAKPKVPEPNLVVRTEQKIVLPQKPAYVPLPPLPKPTPVVQPVPRPMSLAEISKTSYLTEKSLNQPVSVKPAAATPPSPAARIPVPTPPLKPIKPVVPLPPPPAAVRPPPAKKASGIPWWKKIWNAILEKLKGMKSSGKKAAIKKTGSIQSIPGVRLTDIQGNGFEKVPIEWEVNLVPEDSIEKEIPISKILIGTLCVIISMGIVFGGWITANYYYSNVTAKVSGLNGQIASNRIEINSYQDVQKNVRELNQSMANIETLLKKHVYWSGIFNKMENYTVHEVYFTSLTADVNGAVSLNAIGQNYEAAIKQLEVFKRASDFVSKVTVTGICFVQDEKCMGAESSNLLITPSKETVKFSVNLMVQPSIFYWPK